MVLGWVIVVVLVILVIIFLFKSQNLVGFLGVVKHNIFYWILVLIVAFIAFSLFQIHNNYNVSPTSFDGFAQTIKVYYVWAKSVVHNIGSTAGYAVKQDWWLSNITNLSIGK